MMSIGTRMLFPGLLLVASGCSALNDTAYAPSYRQLQEENPVLLRCPVGSMAACESNGSRIRPRIERCQCVRGDLG